MERPESGGPRTASNSGGTKRRSRPEAVRALGERLVAAGLGVPAAARERLAAGVRQVRGATGLTLAMAVATVALNGSVRAPDGTPRCSGTCCRCC
ncbi:hypothetical protein ACIOC1_30150 [Streptomyces sp. NPDC088197]|uniref:hypothetical protein n=1 Tax=Streptomyces sp. NPDC088197 TaxID=3365840 RepID=UPI0037F800C0